MITDAAQRLIAGDPTFKISLLGPAALPTGPQFLLYRVALADTGVE
jgi:hypothetical protein